jgi:GT2 family glycosyltransferase
MALGRRRTKRPIKSGMMSTAAHPMLPSTSHVIPSRERPGLLLDAVESILNGDVVPAEIIVVDQSRRPHERLLEMSTRPESRIRYVRVDSVGLSRARNIGIRAATHGIISFTDDDMLVDRSWFKALLTELVNVGPRTVVTGSVLSGHPEVPGGFVPSFATSAVPRTIRGRVGMDAIHANVIFPAGTFDEVGLFDERLGAGAKFPAAEDSELSYRLLQAGYAIRYIPDAITIHRAWRPASAYIRMRWNYGSGRGAYYAKHLSLRDRYILRRLVFDLASHMIAVPRALFRSPRRAMGNLFFTLGMATAAVRWLLTED